jgi:hypothetical protein
VRNVFSPDLAKVVDIGFRLVFLALALLCRLHYLVSLATAEQIKALQAQGF